MPSQVRILLLLAVTLLPISGCLFRSHQVDRRAVSGVPLKEATIQELVDKINTDAARIRTVNATVDIATEIGGSKKGKVTEFQEIRGNILVRKPGMLRMLGRFPVLRNIAFDMVSDGEHFKLSLPTRNKFIIGLKDVKQPSKQPLENLRPQHIMDAILLREIDPKDEIAVLESSIEIVRDSRTKKDVEQVYYVINVIRKDTDGRWALSRRIYFNRVDLAARKQIIFDAFGNVATIATYDNITDYEGIQFPSIIGIERPLEEYTIQLGMVKLRLNTDLHDDQFVLSQPDGSKLTILDGAVPENTEPNLADPKSHGSHRK